MLDEVLHGVLAELPGARCVVLSARDGVVVAAAATREGPAPDVVAAALADLFRKISAAHREAGLAPPTEFTSGGSSEASGGEGRDRAVSAGRRRRWCRELRAGALPFAEGRSRARTRTGIARLWAPAGSGCASDAPGGSLSRFWKEPAWTEKS